jgi:DNA polymerase III alpha subunit
MPIDPLTRLAAIHYEAADELRFFKLDLLHNKVYNHFQSREEILELIKMEPNWSLLLLKENEEKWFQMSKRYDLLLKLRPRSIEDLADAIALIRPGKAKLIPLYLSQKDTVRQVLYKQTEEFSFKKSHAISYAMVIVLQIHLVEMGLL